MQTPVVTTQSGRATRISAKITKAIQLICAEGLTTAEAAQMVDMKEHTLYTALRKPHVKAYKRQVLEAHTKNLGQKAIKTIADIMADTAAPAGVRRQCAMDLLEMAGFYQKDVVSQEDTPQSRDVPSSFVININGGSLKAEPDNRGIIDVHASPVDEDSDT